MTNIEIIEAFINDIEDLRNCKTTDYLYLLKTIKSEMLTVFNVSEGKFTKTIYNASTFKFKQLVDFNKFNTAVTETLTA